MTITQTANLAERFTSGYTSQGGLGETWQQVWGTIITHSTVCMQLVTGWLLLGGSPCQTYKAGNAEELILQQLP